MSIEASPPSLPPQISPDGKWIWDGQQWQPLPEATWEPAAAAVIPQAAVVAAPVQRRVQYRPLETEPQPAAYSYPVAETPVTPLWEEPAPRSGLTLFMYAGAAVVVLVMLMVLWSANVIQLPWPSSSASPVPSRSPAPLTPEYSRADGFSKLLTPTLVNVGRTLPALQTACTGTLSNRCLTAINSARDQMSEFLSMIDHADHPPCIAAGTQAMRSDVQSMADGLDLSMTGYQDYNGAEVYQGIYHFAYFGRYLQADAAAINAEKAKCSKVIAP
jgi:hypothetical protein